MKIEYRVRPVTRYIVTRYEEQDARCAKNATQHGEYDNSKTAYEVGYALAKAEQDRLGWSLGDERMKYPEPIWVNTTPVCGATAKVSGE